MKKIVCFIMALSMMFSLSLVAFADNNEISSQFQPKYSPNYSSPRPNGMFEITGSNVNLRSGPGTNYSSGGLLDKGDHAGFHPDDPYTTVYDTWPHIKMIDGRNENKGGYVYKDYIVFLENPT